MKQVVAQVDSLTSVVLRISAFHWPADGHARLRRETEVRQELGPRGALVYPEANVNTCSAWLACTELHAETTKETRDRHEFIYEPKYTYSLQMTEERTELQSSIFYQFPYTARKPAVELELSQKVKGRCDNGSEKRKHVQFFFVRDRKM